MIKGTTRWIGYDRNGVPRVYGESFNGDSAEELCRENAKDYIKGRPDTGPLDKWTFELD